MAHDTLYFNKRYKVSWKKYLEDLMTGLKEAT